MILKKVFLVTSTVFLSTSIFANFAHANETSTTSNEDEVVNSETYVLQNDYLLQAQALIPSSEFSTSGYAQYLNNPNLNDASITGIKKEAVVFALRYGGSLVGKITGTLSAKNGKLVTKHSKALGDALDGFSNSIEARLVDFMIFQLGFSSSSARSIAWAICLVAL